MFVLGAGVIAAAGIGTFLKGSVEEAREAVKVGALTEAVLKSTGGAANVSAAQIDRLASSLSTKVGVDDEAIAAGENMLLTFTKVRNEAGKGNDVFSQATRTVQDMAATFGGDATSNSKILGKALNDPIKGVSALTRVGVSFTDKQKEQIKTLVESGDVMGAQKVILKELGKQTKGSAEATASSADKAKVAFDNIKEQVGTALLPVIDKLEDTFVKMAPAIGDALAKVGPFITQLGDALLPVAATLRDALWPIAKKVFEFLSSHTKVLALIAGGLLFLVAPVTAVVVGLALLYTKSKTVRTIFAAIADFVTGTLIPAIGQFVGWVQANLFPIFLQVVAIIRDQVIPIIGELAAFFINKIVPVIVDVAGSVAHSLMPVLDQIVTTVTTKVVPGISKLLAKFEEARPTIQKVVEVAAKLIGGFIKMYAAVLGKVLPVLIRLIAFLVGKFFSGLGTMITQIAAGVRSFIDFGKKIVAAAKFAVEFARIVIARVGNVIEKVKALPGKIKGFFEKLPEEMKTIGGNIVDGLKRGITAAWHFVTDEVQRLINKIPKKIRDLMGISSPSKVTEKLGVNIGEGLAKGVAGTADKVGAATEKLAKKVKEKVAALRDSLASVRSDFASLVEPIASNFTQGLFDFDTAALFTANLASTKAMLNTLIANFTKLKNEGLNPGFLYQLFQSGGPALINSLAGLSAGDAQAAGGLFGEVTSLSNQLGTAVAGNTDKGAALENQTTRLERKLDHLIAATKKVGEDVGEKVGGAASKGHRRGK